jgi:hypothetical protein
MFCRNGLRFAINRKVFVPDFDVWKLLLVILGLRDVCCRSFRQLLTWYDAFEAENTDAPLGQNTSAHCLRLIGDVVGRCILSQWWMVEVQLASRL